MTEEMNLTTWMTGEEEVEEQIREALRNVIDPELGINIVDLGLLQEIEAGEDRVRIDIILTTPSCPLNDYMKREIRETVTMLVPAISTVEVNILREPSWTPDRMDPEARETVGL